MLPTRTTIAEHHLLPYAAVVVVVFAWGIGGALVKLTSISGPEFAFYRMWVGVIVVLGVLRIAGLRLTLQHVRQALPGGLLFGVNVVMFFSAIKLTSVANANLISALQPAIVLLVAGRMFGEVAGRRELLLTTVAMGGVAIVVVGSAGSPSWSPAGDLLAVGAVVLFTGYFLVSKQVRADDLGPLEYTAAIQLIAAFVVTPVALVPDGAALPSSEDWLWIGLVAAFTGVGAHVLMNWAHAYVPVSVSSLMILGVPVVAGPAAWIILGESLVWLQIVGGLITIGAIALVVVGSRRAATDIDDAIVVAPVVVG